MINNRDRIFFFFSSDIRMPLSNKIRESAKNYRSYFAEIRYRFREGGAAELQLNFAMRRRGRGNRKVPTRMRVIAHDCTRANARDTKGAGSGDLLLTSLLGVAYLRSCSERRIPNALLKVASHSPKGRSASISFIYAPT